MYSHADHGHYRPTGVGIHTNYGVHSTDRVKTISGRYRPTGFNRGTHIVTYFTSLEECNSGSEIIVFTISGDNARSGGDAITSFGAITGLNMATGVGSAAIKDTFLGAAVAGNFRKASWFTIEKDSTWH